MNKSQKIIDTAKNDGLKAAEIRAAEYGLNLFAVDVGPGSRVEVWNRAWNRRLAVGRHVSRYTP